MHDWATFRAWEERREELMREAERGRLVRELREARKARADERSGDPCQIAVGAGDGHR